MTTRTVTALFDSRTAAEHATEVLASQLGLARSAIRLDAASASTSAGSPPASATEDKGFLASLADLFLPPEDTQAYAEGIRRGGILLSATADESQIERVSDALEQCGAVDLDASEAAWRQSGWTGYPGAAGVSATSGNEAPDGTPGNPPGTMLSRGMDEVAGTNLSGAHPENEASGTKVPPGVAGATGTADEEAIQLAEERLRVGKRVASAGRVRVRSYVIETPVEEQVSLRQEHVQVERRPVDRAATGVNADLFKERVIDAEERVEEAVVEKDVRVTGEVVVKKDTAERVETVRDTVRRTEVDIDEENAANTNVADHAKPGRAG